MGDLADVPTDWLESYAQLVSDDGEFADDVAAIYRMREIERREGRTFSGRAEDVLAELAERQDPDGSKRRAAEIARLTAEAKKVKELIASYRGRSLWALLKRLDGIEAQIAAVAVSPPA